MGRPRRKWTDQIERNNIDERKVEDDVLFYLGKRLVRTFERPVMRLRQLCNCLNSSKLLRNVSQSYFLLSGRMKNYSETNRNYFTSKLQITGFYGSSNDCTIYDFIMWLKDLKIVDFGSFSKYALTSQTQSLKDCY